MCHPCARGGLGAPRPADLLGRGTVGSWASRSRPSACTTSEVPEVAPDIHIPNTSFQLAPNHRIESSASAIETCLSRAVPRPVRSSNWDLCCIASHTRAVPSRVSETQLDGLDVFGSGSSVIRGALLDSCAASCHGARLPGA